MALETTVIAHGLPWPDNLETGRAIEAAVRDEGATPAAVAVIEGRARIGLNDHELQAVAKGGFVKAGRRDLAGMMAGRRNAATTVSATMVLAHRAGIRVLATGGIGGVHLGAERTFDVSADLLELARTPVCVVCAGAKAVLDVPATLEVLETHGVPVIGYRTNVFPAFYVRDPGPHVELRADDPEQVAELLRCHWDLDGAGVVLAQPCPSEHALGPHEFQHGLQIAMADARAKAIEGKAVTPFLLARVAELTSGKALRANRELLTANARLATLVAKRLSAPRS